MKYQEIKSESEKKRNALVTECSVFFAFSNEQFTANKTPLQEGEKYISIGAGGYMPKSRVKAFMDGLDLISTQEKAEIKRYKQQNEQIKFELYNYECFYTGNLTDAYRALPYKPERILKVYNEERKNANQFNN